MLPFLVFFFCPCVSFLHSSPSFLFWRPFLALFLFGLYLNLQDTGVAALDMLGLSGAANLGSVAGFAAAGLLGLAALVAVQRRT